MMVFSPESAYAKINQVNIFNINGLQVLSVLNPTKNNININRLQPGIYFVKIFYKDGSSISKTIKK